MTETFFHPLGDTITIWDEEELARVIREIDFERGADRQTSDFRERYTLAMYLLTLASRNELKYPFGIAKRETPDFVWTRDGLEIGMEVTEVTSQRFRRGMAQTSSGEVVDLSQFSGTALHGGGWAGNAGEREWVDLLISSVLKKVEDYEQRSPFDRLELLAYSNTPGGCGLEFGDFPETRNSLLLSLEQRDPRNRIGKVFQEVQVIYGSSLIVDAMEHPMVLRPPVSQWFLRSKEILAWQLQAVFSHEHKNDPMTV